MKKSKSIIKALVSAFAVCSMASALTISASAKTYQNGIYRGIENIGSVKSVFTWQTEWNGSCSQITQSSAYQVATGINSNKGGVYKNYTTKYEHGWTAIAEGTLGLSYKGVGVGFVFAFEDIVTLTNAGYLGVKWD